MPLLIPSSKRFYVICTWFSISNEYNNELLKESSFWVKTKNPHTRGWIAESARHSKFSSILQHHHCFQMFKSGHKYFRLFSFSKKFSFSPCSRLFSTHFGFQPAENWVPLYESFLVSLWNTVEPPLIRIPENPEMENGSSYRGFEACPDCAQQLLSNSWCLGQLFAVLATKWNFCLSDQLHI